ncbi:MAG: hypothetical protein ACWGSD_19120 [Thermodesulfobacteriota bacterium]
MSPTELRIGDRITFPFGKGEKEGIVDRVFQKNVYLRVDFPRHPGKLVRRKIDDLEPKGKTKKKK